MNYKKLEELYDSNERLRIKNILSNPFNNFIDPQFKDRIVKHDCINFEFIKEIPNMNNYIDISKHKNITWNIVKNNKNFKWDYKWISLNPNITLDIVKNNLHINWCWYHLSQNKNIKWNDIIRNNELPWDWQGVSLNPNLTINNVIYNLDKKWDFYNLLKNSSFNWDMIKILSEKFERPIDNYNIIYVSQNPNITLDIVKNNNYNWPYEWLSENPNITIDYIIENIDKKWSWYDLSKNPNINFDDVKKTLELPYSRLFKWKWEKLSNNPNITFDNYYENPYLPWYKNILDSNSMPKQKILWINNERLKIIKGNIIHRYWRKYSYDPRFKLARKLILKRAGIE